MAKICRITDGTDEIDLVSFDDPWQIMTGGVSMSPLTDAHLVGDDPVAGKTMVISYKLFASGACHDELKTKASTLFAMLRKAALYHRSSWQLTPVWIEEKARTETNSRKALVLRAMELDRMSVLLRPTDWVHFLIDVGLSIEIEFPWQPDNPRTLPTAVTLTKTQGPADDTVMHLANFRDDVALTHFKELDGAAYTDLVAGDTLFPAVVVQNDALLWGSTDNPLKHIVIPILGTAGAITTSTFALAASIAGPGWTDLVLGVDYTCYPGATLEACFEQDDEDIVISINPIATHASFDLDGDTCYWIRLREEHAAPVYATNPVQHATEAVYAQSSNYIEISAARLKGDHPVKALIRMNCPAGGTTSPVLGTPSRFIFGAKSGSALDYFEPWLNLGNVDNPAAWTTAYGTDASSVAFPEAPGGAHATCDFGGDTTMIPRVILTGADMLAYYRGKYEVFLLYFQTGGVDEDINIKARFGIGGSGSTYPMRETDTVPSLVSTNSYVVASLGEMELPFGEITEQDNLDEDLVIQVYAELEAGASTLQMAAIMLMPINEWSGGLDDPKTETSAGPSALRGATSVDFDNGIVARRAQKHLVQADRTLIPAENWEYTGSLPRREPARKTRVYALQLRFDDDWATAPMIAEIGMHMTIQLFVEPGYIFLRGDE